MLGRDHGHPRVYVILIPDQLPKQMLAACLLRPCLSGSRHRKEPHTLCARIRTTPCPARGPSFCPERAPSASHSPCALPGLFSESGSTLHLPLYPPFHALFQALAMSLDTGLVIYFLHWPLFLRSGSFPLPLSHHCQSGLAEMQTS